MNIFKPSMLVLVLVVLLVSLFLPTWAPPAFALELGRVADCPAGYTNMGLTCYRGPDSMGNGGSTVADCPDGFTNMGLTCQRDADTTSNGGSIAANCPAGFTNMGLTCQRDADTQSNGGSSAANCPVGYTNMGLTCYREPYIYSAPSTVANCPAGYTNTGLTCFRGADTITRTCTEYTNVGLFDVCSGYSACPSAYYSTGLFCQRDPSTLGLNSMTCPNGRFFSSGRCYVNCPSGFTNTGEFCSRGASTLGESAFTCPAGTFYSTGRCYQPCPSGYVNTGVSCYREPVIYGLDAMSCPAGRFFSTGRCYLPCPSGYVNTGASCYREPVIYGLDAMSCPGDRFFSTGRCYLPCPSGYTNTGVSCFRPADSLSSSRMSCQSGEVLSGVRCYPNTSARLNGAQARPFWNYAHNPNTLEDAEAALQDGANALEPDVMYLSGAQYYVGQTLADGLYIYHDDEKVLTRLPLTVEAYFDGIHDLALRYPALSLVAIDIKPPAATSAFGTRIMDAVRNNLLRFGQADEVSLNVIYSVGTRSDGAVFDNILSRLGSREGVQVDSEDDPQTIRDYFRNRGAANIGYGDGTLGANLIGIGPNTLSAIEEYVWLRADSDSPRTAYAFAISDQEALKEYITTGVDAIITDDQEGLARIVAGRTDIRLATRSDNPFQPGNEAYAVKVHTGDVADAGTDSNVTFTLTGCLGQSTASINTSRIGRMERDSTNYLAIPSKDLGRLTSLTVSRDDSGNGPGWWLDQVEISSFNYLSSGLHDGVTKYTAAFKNWVPTSGLSATLSNGPCNIAMSGQTLTRQQGSMPSSGTLANVLHMDASTQISASVLPGEDTTGIHGLNALTASRSGNSGTVTATLGAACNAAPGPHVIAIGVEDSYSGISVSDKVTIIVTANTPPVLGNYPAANVNSGAGTVVHPSSAPVDNGEIASLTASAPGFSGSFSGDPVTGMLAIANAGPAGDHAVTVVASDNCGVTSAYSFPLSVGAVTPVNQPPIANAGTNRSVRLNSQVTLDGSASHDPDSAPQALRYNWSQSSGPVIALTGPASVQPAFRPTVAGTYRFSLTVNDGAADSTPVMVEISVPMLGNIDGDGDVDNNDLAKITAALNKPANGPGDLRDLNGDGKIDILDARKLTLSCTRPRCATQ